MIRPVIACLRTGFGPVTSALLTVTTVLLAGCSGDESGEAAAESSSHLLPVTLQLDYYPEPAHGGFYLAQLNGLYREAGLEVTIATGGPGIQPMQRVATGRAEMAIGRFDEMILAVQQGLGLVALAAYHQHDPQAIMLHADDPARTFEDLDGRAVMTVPGNPFIRWLEKRYGIDINVLPMDYGMQRFLSDPGFIQQCFVTSQPYYVEQQGAETRVLMLSDSGFDPERIIYANGAWAQQHPEAARRFAEASMNGWEEYLNGDRRATDAHILELNEAMSQELNDYSVETMKRLHIVGGRPELELAWGTLSRERIETTLTILAEVGLLEEPVTVDDLVMAGVTLIDEPPAP